MRFDNLAMEKIFCVIFSSLPRGKDPLTYCQKDDDDTSLSSIASLNRIKTPN